MFKMQDCIPFCLAGDLNWYDTYFLNKVGLRITEFGDIGIIPNSFILFTKSGNKNVAYSNMDFPSRLSNDIELICDKDK